VIDSPVIDRNGPCVVRAIAIARGTCGFTLVETLVAAGLLVALTGVMIELARGARAASGVIGAMADADQRLRVAADAIQRDLAIAGAGTADSLAGGSLARYLPPIRPSAARAGDTDITFAADRLTVLWVPRTQAEAEVVGPAGSGGLPIGNGPACRVTPACGFEAGMQAIVFDRRGPGFGYDVFTVADASPGWISKTVEDGSWSQPYGPSSFVSEVVQHSYYLDRSNPANVRLMRGSGHAVFPLVDGVDDARFTYYADPDPMSVSAVGAASGTCAYATGSPPRPLLAVLGGQSLAEVSEAELADGPFCGTAPNRFDADLLRVRRVRVKLRVGASGTAPGASAFELSFDVSPRNLNVSR
jgi:hypothetical protein